MPRGLIRPRAIRLNDCIVSAEGAKFGRKIVKIVWRFQSHFTQEISQRNDARPPNLHGTVVMPNDYPRVRAAREGSVVDLI